MTTNVTQQQLDIVTASNILINLALDSGPFGNVSIRDGEHKCWINSHGCVFQQLQPADIVQIDLHGNVVSGANKPHPGEFIHREIYKRRSDICAIVHTHSPATVMQSILGCPIEPFTQLGAAFYEDQGVYSGFSGPVRDSNEGAAIADALANHTIVIAKNHGLFATGITIKDALWNMILADEAAQIHVDALKMNIRKAETPSAACVAKSRQEVRDQQCDFMWDANVAMLASSAPVSSQVKSGQVRNQVNCRLAS